VRTRVGSDHTLAQKRQLQSFLFEEALHELHHRPFKKKADRVLIPAEASFDFFAAGRAADPDVSRSLRSKSIPHPLFEALHCTPAPEIRRCEPTDLGFSLVVVSPELNAGPVLKGDEQARECRMPVESAGDQIQFFYYERVQQATDVGAGRNTVPGPGLFQSAGAADPATRLQHQHPLPGAGQIGGAGEAVVPRTYDDDIPPGCGKLVDREVL
jgi:hypothetical protein